MSTRSADAVGTIIGSVKPIVTMERDGLVLIALRVKRAQNQTLESPAVGEGADVRFEAERITGSALLREDQVVHAEAHRVV